MRNDCRERVDCAPTVAHKVCQQTIYLNNTTLAAAMTDLSIINSMAADHETYRPSISCNYPGVGVFPANKSIATATTQV
jgi:hypothetical protein